MNRPQQAWNLEDPPRKATVLIVEDDALLRYTLSTGMRDAGYEVAEAANAAEAETVLTVAGPVDLVITDIQMPGAHDGLALARHVRDAWPDMKVIVASGVAPPGGVAGVADAFFGKPYDLGRLIARVQALVGEPRQA